MEQTYAQLSGNSLRVTSRTNERVITACSLVNKKARDAEGLFLCEGVKLVGEAIQASVSIRTLFISDSFISAYGGTKAPDLNKQTTVISVNDETLAKISTEKAPQGIIAVCETLPVHSSDIRDICESDKVVILENIQDPGNLGTIIRCARAFGVTKLILCGDCADIYNPKTLRASMGAAFAVGTVRTNTAAAISALHEKNRPVYAAMPREKAFVLGTDKLTGCVMIGNEGHGLSDEAVCLCDGCVYIPMESGAESLNAAVAASIIMWEMYKDNIGT